MNNQKRVRVCIIDDEPLAREGLCRLITKEEGVDIVGSFAIGQDAVDQLRTLKPDILLLDIQMPQLDGFEVLKEVVEVHQPVVIFVTAHDTYSLKAFQVKALDYLLKPFSDDDLRDTFQRARQYVLGQQALRAASVTYLDTLTIRTKRGLERINVDQIDYISSFDYYSCIVIGSQKHLLRQTMNELEKQLDPAKFVRVHRTAILPIRTIRTITANQVLTSSGAQFPVSRAGLAKFKAHLERS